MLQYIGLTTLDLRLTNLDVALSANYVKLIVSIVFL